MRKKLKAITPKNGNNLKEETLKKAGEKFLAGE